MTEGLCTRSMLQGGGKWSNGDPLKAEDFVCSLRRAVDPVTASPYSVHSRNRSSNAKEITAARKPT